MGSRTGKYYFHQFQNETVDNWKESESEKMLIMILWWNGKRSRRISSG